MAKGIDSRYKNKITTLNAGGQNAGIGLIAIVLGKPASFD